MNKKNISKFVLDFIMLVVLLLLYNKSSINLAFHEIAGLGIFGVFIIHHIINYKWIISITKKFFSKSIPAKSKVVYVVDFLLLICFATIIVSGIMMSEVLFHFANGGGNAKTIHYFSAAVSIILMGIHLGLHTQFLSGMIKKIIPLPKKVTLPAGIILAAGIIVYGGFNIKSTNFLNWLSIPFSSGKMQVPSRDFNPGENGFNQDQNGFNPDQNGNAPGQDGTIPGQDGDNSNQNGNSSDQNGSNSDKNGKSSNSNSANTAKELNAASSATF